MKGFMELDNFDEELYDTFGPQFKAICNKYKKKVVNMASQATAGPSRAVQAKKTAAPVKKAAPTSRVPAKPAAGALKKNASHYSISSSTMSNKGSASTSRSNSSTSGKGSRGDIESNGLAAAAKFGMDMSKFEFSGNKRGGRGKPAGQTIGSAPGSRGGGGGGGIQAMKI